MAYTQSERVKVCTSNIIIGTEPEAKRNKTQNTTQIRKMALHPCLKRQTRTKNSILITKYKSTCVLCFLDTFSSVPSIIRDFFFLFGVFYFCSFIKFSFFLAILLSLCWFRAIFTFNGATICIFNVRSLSHVNRANFHGKKQHMAQQLSCGNSFRFMFEGVYIPWLLLQRPYSCLTIYPENF